MKKCIISPSILSANFAKLGEEVENVITASTNTIHIDIMDNHYVPNLTFGPMICKALRQHGINAFFDVHLMTCPVDDLIVSFAKAGANRISFHPEATKHIDRSLNLIKECGCKTGLAFNPATPLNYLEHTLSKLDVVLLMTVNPGFGGQNFIPDMLNKIQEAKEFIDHRGINIDLAVDGGVNIDTIDDIAQAGANVFIAGSAIFNKPDYKQAILDLQAKLP